MNEQFCKISYSKNPRGFSKIPKDVKNVIDNALVTMRYDTPLVNFKSVGVEVDVTFHNFYYDWWKNDPAIPDLPRATIVVVGRYLIIPNFDGTGMKELEKYGWKLTIILDKDPKLIKMNFSFNMIGYSLPVEPMYVNHRIANINCAVLSEYEKLFKSYDQLIEKIKLTKHQKGIQKRRRTRQKNGTGTGEMIRGYTDFRKASFLYDDGTTKVVYKHSPTSYTIENISENGSTYIEVDGPDATMEIFKMIMSFYKNHEGHIKRHNDY